MRSDWTPEQRFVVDLCAAQLKTPCTPLSQDTIDALLAHNGLTRDSTMMKPGEMIPLSPEVMAALDRLRLRA